MVRTRRHQPVQLVGGLTSEVSIIVLVFIAGLEVFWILLLNVCIGQAIANTRVELIEGFPAEFFVRQPARRLCGALESRRPHGERSIPRRLLDQIR
jgi:hypothetical protein